VRMKAFDCCSHSKTPCSSQTQPREAAARIRRIIRRPRAPARPRPDLRIKSAYHHL